MKHSWPQTPLFAGVIQQNVDVVIKLVTRKPGNPRHDGDILWGIAISPEGHKEWYTLGVDSWARVFPRVKVKLGTRVVCEIRSFVGKNDCGEPYFEVSRFRNLAGDDQMRFYDQLQRLEADDDDYKRRRRVG